MKYKVTLRDGTTKIIDEKNLVDSEDINILDMAILKPSTSGLPVALWFDPYGSSRSVAHHLPRVKMQPEKNNNYCTVDMVPVIVSDSPYLGSNAKVKLSNKELNQVFDFIRRNKQVITAHFNGELDDAMFFAKLRY